MTHKNRPEETLRAVFVSKSACRGTFCSFPASVIPLPFLTWLPLFSRTIFRLPLRQIAVTSSKIRLYVLIYRKNSCEIVCLSARYRMFVSINAYVYFHITVLRSTLPGYVPFAPYSSGQLHAPTRRILRNALAKNAGTVVFHARSADEKLRGGRASSRRN